MLLVKRSILFGLLLSALAASGNAQDASGDELRSLDGQVQEIKSDVLNIASELNILEERLLYPSNTQISRSLSLWTTAKTFASTPYRNRDNGELATHHIYSFKELEALQKGGVQRIYTGNIATGDHKLSVTMMGKLTNGNDFDATTAFQSKGVKPKAARHHAGRPGVWKERNPDRRLVNHGSSTVLLDRAPAVLPGGESGPWRRAEGFVFRRGALLCTPGLLLRGAGATRHRSQSSTTTLTSRNSTRCSTISTMQSFRLATSSCATACIIAPGRAIKAVLEGAVDEEVRNDAAYRLARIHFQKEPAGRRIRAPWTASTAKFRKRFAMTSNSCGQISISHRTGRGRSPS